MLIVCAGRSRSGSTLLYNLVRLTLIEAFGKSKVYARGVRYYKKKHELKYNIVKLHDSNDRYFERNADYVFSSNRNESDQRKSIVKFRNLMKNHILNKKNLDEFVKYDLRRYKKWSSHKNFVKTFKFNTLVNNKEKIVKEISDKLNLNIDNIDIIVEKVNSLPLPSKNVKIDRESCLTWHHITGRIN